MALELWANYSAKSDAIIIELYAENTTNELARVYYKNTTSDPLWWHLTLASGVVESNALDPNTEVTTDIRTNQRPSLDGVNVTFGGSSTASVKK